MTVIGLTVTVALEIAEPEHETEYVVVTEGVTVTVPEVPEAVKPVPVQEVAFAEDQVRVADCPAVIVEGEALMEAVGPAVPLY